jgi:hypothetical protein
MAPLLLMGSFFCHRFTKILSLKSMNLWQIYPKNKAYPMKVKIPETNSKEAKA